MTKFFSISTSERFGMFESFDFISYDGKLNKKLGLSSLYKSKSSSLVDNPNGKISDLCLRVHCRQYKVHFHPLLPIYYTLQDVFT